MRTLMLALAVLPAALADDAPRLDWPLDGYARLPEAFRAAKAKGTRVLVGLAGSPT